MIGPVYVKRRWKREQCRFKNRVWCYGVLFSDQINTRGTLFENNPSFFFSNNDLFCDRLSFCKRDELLDVVQYHIKILKNPEQCDVNCV